ncbi:hypothetical protein HPB50_004301 [Hyalomma asiaticum]|uniref:Uncharacterized protein n=1 Tax=Hyalomma asiaticum TaxID=266040 RepID=A0ACB7SKR6_HYAAI|nr:hypothetical protein HPB50_004301 [Hyalomma asiaticum]
MEQRLFKKKSKTTQQFGARKRKSPTAKKFSPATSAGSDSAGSVQDDADSQPSSSSAHGTSSASIDETVHTALEQCFVPVETLVHHAALVADIVDARPSTSREVADIADAWPSTSCEVADIADARPSTSRKVADITDAQPSALRKDAPPSISTTKRMIQAQLEPRFVSADASRERATAVQESLSAVSATEHKLTLMGQGESGATTEAEE